MTHQERIAAGWQPHWGVYDWHDGNWIAHDGGWTTDQKPRRLAMPLSGAVGWSQRSWPARCEVTPRRFWRRKKPKAPPPLKVGDVVTVTFTVIATSVSGTNLVRAKTGSEQTFCFTPEDVDIVEVRRP